MPEPVEAVDAAAVCVRRPDPAQRGVVRRAAARRRVAALGRGGHATPTSWSWSARRRSSTPPRACPSWRWPTAFRSSRSIPNARRCRTPRRSSLRETAAARAARPAAAAARAAGLSELGAQTGGLTALRAESANSPARPIGTHRRGQPRRHRGSRRALAPRSRVDDRRARCRDGCGSCRSAAARPWRRRTSAVRPRSPLLAMCSR